MNKYIENKRTRIIETSYQIKAIRNLRKWACWLSLLQLYVQGFSGSDQGESFVFSDPLSVSLATIMFQFLGTKFY